MPDTLTIFLSSMAIGQAVLALLLILSQKQTRHWQWPLAVFMTALIFVEFDTPLKSLAPQIADHYWIFSLMPLCLICPALWIYLTALTTAKNLKPARHYWPHTLPSILALFVFLGYFSLSDTARKNLSYDGPPAPFDREAFIALCLVILAMIWLMQVITYVCLCLKKLSRHRKEIRDQYANLSGRELRWVSWLSVMLACYAVFSVTYLFIGDTNIIANRVDGLFTFAVTGFVAFLGLRQKPEPIARYARS